MSQNFLQPVSPNFDLASSEDAILDFWKREKIFEKSVESKDKNKSFVFFEGPPTANGKPGFHHIIARAFKDLIPRYKTMNGFRVERKAGWDTHGLPVELQVEKELGISGKNQIENIIAGDRIASIKKFNELCRESVWKYKNEWEKLTERMGFWLDLTKPYITYENNYIESIWWILKKAFEEQLLYLDYKIVPYCTRCGTALSSHEVALGYKEVFDRSVYVKFKVKNKDNTYFVAWTTTPWTLPGNLALAISGNVNYGLYENKENGEKLILADEKASGILDIGNYSRSSISTEEMVDLKYEPLFNVDSLNSEESFSVGVADFVNTTDGSGIVHIAPMYGEDDFKFGEKMNLPKVHTVDTEGKFITTVKELAGEKAKQIETEKKIINLLKEKQLLLKIENYKHTYPFCWRCDTPLIYYGKESWFIKMSSLRGDLIKRNNTIKWVPSHLQEGRFGEWLREVKDWALSRDRYWGTPLPIWSCVDCKKNICLGSVEELKKLSVQEIVVDIDLHKPYIDEIKIKCDCGGQAVRYPEVIDVWFDSGAMPFAQWHYPFENKNLIDNNVGYPADYISEAIDQTRGWFYTLVAISAILKKPAPFKSAIVMAHILDKQGKKMSKSRGNIVDPWQVIEQFGIDPLRFYFYSVNQPGDTKKFDTKDLETIKRKIFMITWNVYSFLASASKNRSWKPTSEPVPGSKNILDVWLHQRTSELIDSVSKSLDNLDIFKASRLIADFIDDLSTWYLRLSRKRTDDDFLPTLFWSIKKLALVIAPFAPFFAENLWQKLRLENDALSVHLALWPKREEIDQKVLENMQSVKNIIEIGRRLRQENNTKLRQPLASVEVYGLILSKDQEEIITEELNVKVVHHFESENLKVNFDFEISPELKVEGFVRELIRFIQDLRKKSGLEQGEKADLVIRGEALDSFLPTWSKEIEKATSTIIVDKISDAIEADFNGLKIFLKQRS